jgi:hypothetical protein
MTLQEITNAANAFTDENFRAATVLYFVNEAISMINAELKAELPYFESTSVNYTALDDTWIRTLLVPYASYGIKQNDGSLNEATIFLNSYQEAFRRAQENKMLVITEDYRSDDFGGIYLMETENAINIGWFGGSDPTDDGFE